MEDTKEVDDKTVEVKEEDKKDEDAREKEEKSGKLSASENTEEKVDIKSAQFSSIRTGGRQVKKDDNINRLMGLELPIAIELGRIKMLVKDILELGPGAIVKLDKFSDEPVDVYVNNKKFAEGEVVVVDQNFGVRITALVGPNERLPEIS